MAAIRPAASVSSRPRADRWDTGWKSKIKAIKNYQAVVPSTWNAGPRDAHGQRGAYEAALLKTPVADPERPLELLRTIHSFDPCLACAVHVVDARGRIRAERAPERSQPEHHEADAAKDNKMTSFILRTSW